MFSISSARLYEWKRVYNTIIRRTGLALGVALLASSLASSPASATPGLFGSADATYDGVYRQSLVIAGLRANKVAVPKAATDWLKAQQCADGGFEPFRHDPTVACAPGDPATYSGEDTNSTAAAALAFAALKDSAHAKRALAYLRSTQNADGGFPYYAGGDSDVDSTAIVVQALTANGIKAANVHARELSPIDFFVMHIVGCEADASARGGLSQVKNNPLYVSHMSTVAALVALASITPWVDPAKTLKGSASTPVLKCPGTLSDDVATLRTTVSGFVARTLAAHENFIPGYGGVGSDLTSTAWAVIGLNSAHRRVVQIKVSERALQAGASAYVADATGTIAAGRVGVLLLLVASRKSSPRNFGGVDLIKTALGTLSKS